jgi:uncharacterized protein YndB with AHSA1/START domain
MAERKDSFGTAPEKGELIITRVFDAPRELVFRAWSDKIGRELNYGK